MTTMLERLTQDRRRKVLELLQEGRMRLPEGTIKTALRHVFDDGIGEDEVRQYLTYLSQHGLVRLEKLAREDGSELWRAELTEAGQTVARGRTHVGIAERDAR